MKLDLVMLTIVISMMAERQVEAASFELVCYEDKTLLGFNVTITKNLPDIKSQFPKGIKACNVTGTVIFYSKPQYDGDTNGFHANGGIYVPPPSFKVKSILVLGNREGLFLFQNKDFEGGLYHYFPGDVDKVQGNKTFGGAVVIGRSSNWSIARGCHQTDCKRKCFTCVEQENSASWVSFVRSIDGNGMGQTLAVFQDVCKGKTYTGISALKPCGCNKDGVENRDYSCTKDGQCRCSMYHRGKKCKGCFRAYHKGPHCIPCNCPWKRITKWEKPCHQNNGTCKCKTQFAGEKCETCSNAYPITFRAQCFTQKQNKTMHALQDYCSKQNGGKSAIYSLITVFFNSGYKNDVRWVRIELDRGWKSPTKAACDAIRYVGNAVVD